MIKTIKVKKEMTFRELMEYIIQNDVSGKFESCGGRRFKVNKNGTFEFWMYSYGFGELYEVDVLEEITEDTEFDFLVEVTKNGGVFRYVVTSISEKKDNDSKEFHTLIGDELIKIWECE